MTCFDCYIHFHIGYPHKVGSCGRMVCHIVNVIVSSRGTYLRTAVVIPAELSVCFFNELHQYSDVDYV